MNPPNYTTGPQAIYKGQVYKVMANYTEEKQVKILFGKIQIVVPYDELFAVMTESEINLRLLEDEAKAFTAKTNV